MSFYKYYTPESFDFIFVDNGVSARFSQPSVLNDIFEFSRPLPITEEGAQEWYKLITQINPELKKLSPHAISPILEDFVKRAQKDELRIHQKNNDKNYGIFSLSKNKQSNTMWAYYGKDHKGYLIEFNKEFEKSPIISESYFSDFVNYEKERPPIPARPTLENLKYIHFNKSKEWEGEQEYRIIKFIQDIPPLKTDPNGFPIHCLTIPSNEIKGIYLGARSDLNLERKARFWIEYHAPNVKLYKANASMTSYLLDYEELDL